MGSIDVPKVIQAAATSNLGVISLLALVLAFLAWRFFQNSGDKVKLVAFGMMFLGAIGFGAAVLSASGDPKVATAQAAPTPSPVPAASLAAVTSPEAKPTSSDTPAPANPDNLTGTWHDDQGFEARFTQTGDRFRYTATNNGAPAGTGQGTIAGRQLEYGYRDESGGDTGSCEAVLSADGKRLDGKCRSSGGGNGWDLVLTR